MKAFSLPIFQFSLGLPSFLAEHETLMRDYTHYAMAGVMVRDDSNGTITLTENSNPKVHYNLGQNEIETIADGVKVLAEMWFDAGATKGN